MGSIFRGLVLASVRRFYESAGNAPPVLARQEVRTWKALDLRHRSLRDQVVLAWYLVALGREGDALAILSYRSSSLSLSSGR